MKAEREKYGDMLDMDYKKDVNRSHMSMEDRAAQFAPFAALVGHDIAIKETARLTDEDMDLTEDSLNILNYQMLTLINSDTSQKSISITYFIPDNLKKGGNYKIYKGIVEKVDIEKGIITFADGREVDLDSIRAIDML